MTSPRKYTRLLAPFLLLFVFAACGDSNFVTNTDDEATPTELNALAARLSTDLNLTTEQVNQVDDLLATGDDPAPGYLWTVAAELQQTLTDEQKETLFKTIEERQAVFAERRRGSRFNRDGQRFNRDEQGQGRRFQRDGDRGTGFRSDFLTPEQQETMKALREANRAEMKALVEARENGTLTDEDFRTQAKALREASREAMQDLLTEEQKATLEQKREAMKTRRAERKATADDARIEALGLTADQEVILTEMHEANRAEMKALVEQMRDGNGDRETVRAEMQALRDAHKAALADVLTPEQLEITNLHHALMGGIMAKRGGKRTGVDGARGARGFRGQQ